MFPILIASIEMGVYLTTKESGYHIFCSFLRAVAVMDRNKACLRSRGDSCKGDRLVKLLLKSKAGRAVIVNIKNIIGVVVVEVAALKIGIADDSCIANIYRCVS